MPRPKLKPQFRKRPLTLTIKPEVLKIAKAHAHSQGVSLSELVERLLLQHFTPTAPAP
jgi:predicted HicB family RNase H-like nuclease